MLGSTVGAVGARSCAAGTDLGDVLAAFGVLFFGTLCALAALAISAGEPLTDISAPQQMAAIYAQAAVSLFVVSLSTVTVLWRHQGSPRDLGWDLRCVGRDVRLGCVAFVGLAPPVYALQLLLVTWFKSHHPLVELLQRDPQPKLIAACVVSAAVVAPVAEEYLFRGLLQGWLEGLAVDRGLARDRRPKSAISLAADQSAVAPACDPVLEADVDHPYRYRHPRETPMEDTASAAEETVPHVPFWPIVVSALIFALLHLSHGPDWIPLFLLALGLGYLYRQTHRLLPCIVVHFLLNACSLAMFLFEIFAN